MKTNKNKKLIAIGLMLSMFVLYGVLPLPQDAKAINSLKDASATISDSDFNVVATTTLEFTTATYIPAGGTIRVTIDNDFPAIAASGNIDCGAGGAYVSGAGVKVALCSYAAGVATGTVMTMEIGNTNPYDEAALSDGGDLSFTIETLDGATLLDRVTTKVFIIQDVWMTAKVEPILEFTITGVTTAAAKTVNGVLCDSPVDSTATTTPFGTLDVGTKTTVCQRLNVQTNADDGYIVTVEQDQELTSDSGSNINSFNNAANGTGLLIAEPWAVPTNTLDAYHTYGHMGVTSDDQDLATVNGDSDLDYYNGGAAAQYAGLNSTDPLLIMSHDGPSDGTTQNIGEAFVAYSAEIASLQEAGDYENTLTYIVTPTY